MTTTNLTSHAPSFGNYQYSITTAALTSCEPSVGYFFSFGDSLALQVFKHRITIIKIIAGEMKRNNFEEMKESIRNDG